MNFSKPEVRRARPALGTILRLHLWDDEESLLHPLSDDAFARAEALEKIFSKFRDDSDLNRVNRAAVGRETRVSAEFRGALMLALEVWRASKGAFTPFTAGSYAKSPVVLTREGILKIAECTIDLSGIAKGFIVDELADLIRERLPTASAVIDAGGDLRFVNCTDRPAYIRLASQRLQALQLSSDSLATSALTEWLYDHQSSTIYHEPPVHSAEHTVSAIAETCAVADALTKVGWFAPPETRDACARHFGAEILVLSADGERQ
jgi:FAD:protein FMN transferase